MHGEHNTSAGIYSALLSLIQSDVTAIIKHKASNSDQKYNRAYI